MNKREIGYCKETVAADYLMSQGLTIIARNYRCRIGEIDIIALDNDTSLFNRKTYVFVEVKYRTDKTKGEGYEAVDFRKRRKIIQVARYFCMTKGGLIGYDIRFDVISILNDEITWYKNAFLYE